MKRESEQFRAQDSNLSFWVQRPVSCQLDDPGAIQDVTAREREGTSVGPEGVEPSTRRVRAGCAAVAPRTRGEMSFAMRRRVPAAEGEESAREGAERKRR